jgi:hypothetical protein
MTVMIVGVECVTVRCMRVMRGRLVVTGFGVFGSFAMVFCGVLVMFRCLLVVLVDFVLAHWRLPSDLECPRLIRVDEFHATVFRLCGRRLSR